MATRRSFAPVNERAYVGDAPVAPLQLEGTLVRAGIVLFDARESEGYFLEADGVRTRIEVVCEQDTWQMLLSLEGKTCVAVGHFVGDRLIARTIKEVL
jgi:hypothetical protein